MSEHLLAFIERTQYQKDTKNGFIQIFPFNHSIFNQQIINTDNIEELLSIIQNKREKYIIICDTYFFAY